MNESEEMKLNTIGENSIINTYGVSNENTVAVNSRKTENMAVKDDTAAILNLSEEAFGDGVVTVKSTAATVMSTRTSNQSYQSMLSTLKLYNGPIDGNLSSSLSTKAINNFQRVYGLDQTGTLNSQTSTKLENVYDFYCDTLRDSDMTNLKNTLFPVGERITSGLANVLTNNLALTWTFLIKGMGLGEVQAAGAMGNIMHESFFSPTNANDQYNNGQYGDIQDTDYNFEADTNNEVAYGLIQWKFFSRRDDLEYVAGNMGLNVGDINAQFACIRYESETSYSNAWSNLRLSGSVASATQIFKDQYEQCSDNTLAERTNYANTIYTAL